MQLENDFALNYLMYCHGLLPHALVQIDYDQELLITILNMYPNAMHWTT